MSWIEKEVTYSSKNRIAVSGKWQRNLSIQPLPDRRRPIQKPARVSPALGRSLQCLPPQRRILAILYRSENAARTLRSSTPRFLAPWVHELDLRLASARGRRGPPPASRRRSDCGFRTKRESSQGVFNAQADYATSVPIYRWESPNHAAQTNRVCRCEEHALFATLTGQLSKRGVIGPPLGNQKLVSKPPACARTDCRRYQPDFINIEGSPPLHSQR